MAAKIVWEDTDGLDRFRLVVISNPPAADIYHIERSQQNDSMGVPIWHPFQEVPARLAGMMLQSQPPEDLKNVDFKDRIGLQTIDPVTQISVQALERFKTTGVLERD